MSKFKIAICTIFLVYFAGISPASAHSLGLVEERSNDLAARTALESRKALTRWNHAKELLGKHYLKSVVKSGEGISTIDHLLHQWTDLALQGNWKQSSHSIAKAIIYESERYGFDPVFLMAIIKSESNFNPTVIGSVGEVGLMQIIPATAKWISEKYNMPWRGAKSLTDPVTNIKIGAAYMSYLREKFNLHGQLYLAAYNMGSTNVNRSLEKQIWPKVYPSRVMQNYYKYYAKIKEETQKPIKKL